MANPSALAQLYASYRDTVTDSYVEGAELASEIVESGHTTDFL